MKKLTRYEMKKVVIIALKMGVGGSTAYYIAELFQLQFSSSAGIIALLTLQTTKWEAFYLSVRRIVTFFITLSVCWIVFHVVRTPWLDYGIYLFGMVFLCEVLGWRNVLSTNAVIAAHFFSAKTFASSFVRNEFLLVIIGITVAIVLNLFHINGVQEQVLIKNMRRVESKMKHILIKMSKYLKHQSMDDCVWEYIKELEQELKLFLDVAHEYQNNTFASHPEYYISYFRMRREQCGALLNLHKEMNRISQLPQEAEIVSEYILDMCAHLNEMNDPQKQIVQLENVVDNIKNQPLPKTRENFESSALLYHVLMELEDFLLYKKRFIETIDEKQFQVYWKKEVEGK